MDFKWTWEKVNFNIVLRGNGKNKTEINILWRLLSRGAKLWLFLWLVSDTRAETGIESILAWWDRYFTFNSSSTFSSYHLALASMVCTNTAPFPSCTTYFVHPPPLLCCRAVVWLRDAENKWQVTTDHGRKKAGHRRFFFFPSKWKCCSLPNERK